MTDMRDLDDVERENELRAQRERGDDVTTATDADKLRTLADWFDKYDRRVLAKQLGVTDAEVPDYMLGQFNDVQTDLRRIADQLDTP